MSANEEMTINIIKVKDKNHHWRGGSGQAQADARGVLHAVEALRVQQS
jgi:hypothetical protein